MRGRTKTDDDRNRTAFQEKMVDALGSYVVSCFPSLVRFYQALDHILLRLLLGGDSACTPEREDWIMDTLIECRSSCAHEMEN